MSNESTVGELRLAHPAQPTAITPPPVLAGHQWSKRGQPGQHYEEWGVSFGDLYVVLYRDLDPDSESFNLWGAEIGGENIGEFGQGESEDVEVIVAFVRERVLLTARVITWAAGRQLRSGSCS